MVLGLAFLILLTGCANKPGWINQVPEDAYSVYVLGLSSGAPSVETGMKLAAGSAVEQLIDRFGIEAQARYREWKTELEAKVQDELESVSETVHLRGHLISDWHVVPRTVKGKARFDVYVLLRYPKAEFARERARLRQHDLERRRQIRQAITEGDAATTTGDVSGAISAYLEAIRSASGKEEILSHQAFQRLRSLIASLRIQILSGNEQVAIFPRGPAQPFVVTVHLQSGATAIPARGVPVTFRVLHEKGIKAFPVRTDSDGIAKWHIQDLARRANRILVRADLQGMKDELGATVSEHHVEGGKVLSHLLASRSVDFLLTVRTVAKDTTVLPAIQEFNFGIPVEPRVVEAQLAKSLEDAGYQVLASHPPGGPDILVTGTCLTRAGSDNLEIIRSSRAEGDIEAIDRKTGKVLARIRLEAVGFGDNDQAAGRQALKVLSEPLAQALILQLEDHEGSSIERAGMGLTEAKGNLSVSRFQVDQ